MDWQNEALGDPRGHTGKAAFASKKGIFKGKYDRKNWFFPLVVCLQTVWFYIDEISIIAKLFSQQENLIYSLLA